MVGRVLLAAVVSAVLVMAWGFLYWGVFNVGGMISKPVPMDLETGKELKKRLPMSGMYLYPFPAKWADAHGQVLFKAKYNTGPVYRIAYQAEGGSAMPASKLISGFALNFVVALLASGLVAMAGRGLPKFDSRFCFVLLLSLFATVWANVSDVIWWFHTPAYCLGNIVYGLVSGLLMGIVIGSLVCPAAEPAEADSAETAAE